MTFLEFFPIGLAVTGVALRFYLSAEPREAIVPTAPPKRPATGTFQRGLLAYARRLRSGARSSGTATA